MANVPKDWLIDERNATMERIKFLEEDMEFNEGDGYLPTINFLRRYICTIDDELAKKKSKS